MHLFDTLSILGVGLMIGNEFAVSALVESCYLETR